VSLAPNDTRHGTNGYGNLGCRCEVCTSAQAVKMREYREYLHHTGQCRSREDYLAARRANLAPHGTESRYTGPDRCRCEECKCASREARARRRNRVAA
jgi:hypothetical protein